MPVSMQRRQLMNKKHSVAPNSKARTLKNMRYPCTRLCNAALPTQARCKPKLMPKRSVVTLKRARAHVTLDGSIALLAPHSRQCSKSVGLCTQLVMSSEGEEAPASRLRPHRCNARVEDLLQSLFTLEFSAKVRPAWRNVRACLKSEPGQEPTEPYLVVKDPDLYLNPDRMTLKRGRE